MLGTKIYDKDKWRIYRQDAGMGEHDYAVFYKDYFICRTGNEDMAKLITATLFWHGTKVDELAPMCG